MKKTLLILLGLSMALPLVPAPASAQASPPPASTWFTFLPIATRTLLLQRGEVSHTGRRIQDLKWLQAAPWGQVVAPVWQGQETTIAAEMIRLVDLPVRAETPRERLLRAFNTLNAVSQMQGTQYWSVTRQQWETLILESYRVASPAQNQRLADPSFATVPPSSTLTVFQKDNRFGGGYSRIVYTARPNGFLITLRNLTSLKYGVLPVVDPGNLQMTFAVSLLQDKAVIYTVMGAKTAPLAGVESLPHESLKNRMQAFTRWFAQRL